MILFSAIFYTLVTFDFLFGYAYKVSVWQIPRVVDVAEGASANITCHFYIPDVAPYKLLAINWIKDNQSIEGLHFQRIELHQSNTSSRVLQLNSLLRNQSGLYTCEVKSLIPFLRIGQGNGTYVHVTASGPEHSGSPETLAVYICVLASGVLILLLTVGFFMVFRRFKRENQTREDRTENVPQESASQDTDEITYASINKQKFHCRENRQKLSKPETMRCGTQGQDSTSEHSEVFYSAIHIRHAD